MHFFRAKSPSVHAVFPQQVVVVGLWSLERIQKKCLSARMRVTLCMVTYGQIYFKTATSTPMPHASGRSPREGNRHGPNHASSGALCVELSELASSIQNGVTGRAAAINRSPEASGKIACQLLHFVYKWNRLVETEQKLYL